MRQFLNTLFVLNESACLSLDGENVVVSCDKTEVGRVALHTLESILCFSYAGASPALMGKCGRLGIDLCFFSPQGRRSPRGGRGLKSPCGAQTRAFGGSLSPRRAWIEIGCSSAHRLTHVVALPTESVD